MSSVTSIQNRIRGSAARDHRKELTAQAEVLIGAKLSGIANMVSLTYVEARQDKGGRTIAIWSLVIEHRAETFVQLFQAIEPALLSESIRLGQITCSKPGLFVALLMIDEKVLQEGTKSAQIDP